MNSLGRRGAIPGAKPFTIDQAGPCLPLERSTEVAARILRQRGHLDHPHALARERHVKGHRVVGAGGSSGPCDEASALADRQGAEPQLAGPSARDLVASHEHTHGLAQQGLVFAFVGRLQHHQTANVAFAQEHRQEQVGGQAGVLHRQRARVVRAP